MNLTMIQVISLDWECSHAHTRLQGLFLVLRFPVTLSESVSASS